MLRYILLFGLAACALESGPTAITASDLAEYTPVYALSDSKSMQI